MKKGKMTNLMLEIFREFSWVRVLIYQHSKFMFFASDYEFLIEVNEYLIVVDILTQILLTILLSIDYFSRCKLNVYIITHTKGKPSATN